MGKVTVMTRVRQTLIGVGWSSAKSLRAIAVAAVALTGACTTPSTYLDSIKKFQTAAVATSTTARTYLLDLNRFERNTYLDTLRADPKKEFDSKQFLDKPFAPEAIQARVEALDAVIRYAGLLGQLASSTAGQDAQDAATNLAKQIKTTADTFDQDAKGPNKKEAADFVTPLGELAGAIAKIAIEEAQVSALNDAIEAAAPSVRTIAGLLRNDLKNAVDRHQLVFSRNRANTIRQYERKQYSGESERLRLLQAIQDNEDKWDQTPASGEQVAALVDSFGDAHEALVMYAKSSRGAGDLASLTAAIELFAARADSVLTPLQKLSEAKAQSEAQHGQ